MRDWRVRLGGAGLHVKRRIGGMARIGEPGHGKQERNPNQTRSQQANNRNQFVISVFHCLLLMNVLFTPDLSTHPERNHQYEDNQRH